MVWLDYLPVVLMVSASNASGTALRLFGMCITPIWFRRFIAARHVAIPGWHSAAKPLLNGPGSRAGGRYREKGSPSWRGRGVSYSAFGPDARLASAIAAMPRSEARRVGHAWVSKGRSRGA